MNKRQILGESGRIGLSSITTTTTVTIGKPHMSKTQLKQHYEYERICAAMQRLRNDGIGVAFQETVYRATSPKFASLQDLISGTGSKLHGSRWNPPNSIAVLHAASLPEGAVSEAMATNRRFNLPDKASLPLILQGLHCSLHQVLDLCDGEIRRSIRVSQSRILKAKWLSDNQHGTEAITQAIWRAAVSAGFEGLLIPISGGQERGAKRKRFQ